MKWFYSASVGSSGNSFPESVLRNKLSEKPSEMINANQHFYPTDGELGMLASIVYEEYRAFPSSQLQLTQRDKNRLEGELLETQEECLPSQLRHFFEQWSCVFRFIEEESGYSGAVYIHQQLPQLVIVNEGTRTKAHMISDAVEIASSTLGEHTETSAAVDILKKIKMVLDAFPYYAVSITGHSLGGWLSLISTLEAAKLGWRIHTVTFDSPGAMPMLDKRRNEISSDIGLASLDIRTILSSVNVVNMAHTHAPGTIRVFPNLDGVKGKVNYVLESHSIRNILEAFNEQGQIPDNQYCIVDNWPTITPIQQDISSRSLMRIVVRAAQSLFDSEVRASLGDCKAFFDFCENHFNQYHSPERSLSLLEQGELDGMMYGRVHYKTTPADPFSTRLAHLNQTEQSFLKFMLVARSAVPGLKAWFEEKGYGQLFDLLLQVELNEQYVFKVTGEKDPHIVMKDRREEYKTNLDQLMNVLHHFIRRYPTAERDIQEQFRSTLQQTRNKVENLLAQQAELPERVRQLVEAHLSQLAPTPVKKEKSLGKVHSALFARRDAHVKKTTWNVSNDETVRKMREDELRLEQEFKQKEDKGSEPKENKPLSPEELLSVTQFEQFINDVIQGREVDDLIVGLRDAYHHTEEIIVQQKKVPEGGKGPNP